MINYNKIVIKEYSFHFLSGYLRMYFSEMITNF